MTRFLVAPVTAVAVLLSGAPAFAEEADVKLPNLGQCLSVRETGTGIGVQVCIPPTS